VDTARKLPTLNHEPGKVSLVAVAEELALLWNLSKAIKLLTCEGTCQDNPDTVARALQLKPSYADTWCYILT
jgi:hypothetical protein